MADLTANTSPTVAANSASGDSSKTKSFHSMEPQHAEAPKPSNVIYLRLNDTIPVHLQEQINRIESMHIDLFERIADDQLERIISAVNAAGFDTSHEQPGRGERIENDITLIYEAIVSMLCRTVGYKHMLHDYSDKLASESVDDSDDVEDISA